MRGWLGRLVAVYTASQRALLGRHGAVEQTIAARAIGNVVRREDRENYRACFYWPVRGWNLLGDNARRFAIAAFVLLHHLEWFVAFTLGPMNLILVALWIVSAPRRSPVPGAVDKQTVRRASVNAEYGNRGQEVRRTSAETEATAAAKPAAGE